MRDKERRSTTSSGRCRRPIPTSSRRCSRIPTCSSSSAQPLRILELGSGQLAREILVHCEVKKYVALDFSPVMHAIATEYLGELASRVTFETRDSASQCGLTTSAVRRDRHVAGRTRQPDCLRTPTASTTSAITTAVSYSAGAVVVASGSGSGGRWTSTGSFTGTPTSSVSSPADVTTAVGGVPTFVGTATSKNVS